MRKHYFVLSLLLLLSAVTISAAGLSGKKIYIDPGHGSYGPNDRPMATISYPMLASTGRPQTGVGFYESNTNLWKAEKLEEMLLAAGAKTSMSHRTCGGLGEDGATVLGSVQSNATHNPDLSARRQEATTWGADYFISIHSNAASEGTETNFPSLFYRGQSNGNYVSGDSPKRAQVMWPKLWEAFETFEQHHQNYSSTKMCINADITYWQGNYSISTVNGVSYRGYYGVLRHGIPGYISEGYFHTYQPARHRALNKDWCRQEGVRYYRGIAAYYDHAAETKGYIMGVVKSADKKMTQSATLSPTSFYYKEGTHDQYVPLNGATVKLMQNGEELKTYTVDNNYNGVFVFEDLEPGTYQVKASCAGHKSLTYDVTVVANTTQYPIMLLSEGADEPLVALEPISMQWNWNAVLTDKITGVIRRTLQYGDNIIILTHEATTARTPHIYAINQRKINADGTLQEGAVTELSTTGVTSRDNANAGDYLSISDIALTSDGKLVACNFIRCQYGTGSNYVDAGYKRGTIRFYKWESLNATPSLWVSKSEGGTEAGENYHSGNFYRADVGYTLAVSGSSDNCVLTVTAVQNNQTALRYAHIQVINDVIASGTYTKYGATTNATDQPDFLKITAEANSPSYHLNTSPLGSNRWVIDGTTTYANEFLQGANAATNTINGTIPTEHFAQKLIETNFALYQGHHLATAPYFEDSKLKAVRVLDITNGFSSATKVTLQNKAQNNAELVLASPFKEANVQYASATTQPEGKEDMHVYLLVEYTENNARKLRLTKYSTKTAEKNEEVEVAANEAIYPFKLLSSSSEDKSTHTFSFYANDLATSGYLVFYRNGIEVHRIALADFKKGSGDANKNTLTVQTADLLALTDYAGNKLFANGDVLTWAVELTNENKVLAWKAQELGSYTKTEGNECRVYHTVDIYPSSPQFGHVYVAHENGFAATNNNGLYCFNQWLQEVTSPAPPYHKGEFFKPRHMTVDSKGNIYIPELRDAHSGVWVTKTAATVSGEYTQFFSGTMNTSGVFYQTSEVVTGASSSSAHIYGTGKDTKLLVYNEDAAVQLKKNGVSIYNIGTSVGNITTQWTTHPSKTYDMQLSGIGGLVEGNVWGTSHGFFLGLKRGAGANSGEAPTLQFIDYEGNQLFSSITYAGAADFNQGCEGTFAVSRNEDMLIFDDGVGNFIVYDLTWNGHTPTLTKRDTYAHNLGKMYQMNFDYAGNLFASNDHQLFRFAVPTTDDNTCLVPAREELTITIVDPSVQQENQEIEFGGAAIYAANLKMEALDTETYILSFTSNENATAGYLLLYEKDATIQQIEDGTAILKQTIDLKMLPGSKGLPTKGENTYTIPASEIEMEEGEIIAERAWGVKLKSKSITADNDWEVLYEAARADSKFNGLSSLFVYNAVDIYPESPNFGNIYALNYHKGQSADNGFFVYKQDETSSETLYQTDVILYPDVDKRPRYAGLALSVASDGRVFIPDYDNARKGVYVTEPTDFNNLIEFFEGELSSQYVINNNGVVVGSPTSVAAVYGRGEDRKLLTVSRFNSGSSDKTIIENRVIGYNIGEATSWGAKPSFTTEEELTDDTPIIDGVIQTSTQAKDHRIRYASIAPTKEGFWITREDNNDGMLWFYDWTGKRKWKSKELDGISVSDHGALAVSRDGKTLVVYNGNSKLSVFTVADDLPNSDTEKSYLTANSNIDALPIEGTYQMNFDYAGNLVVSGEFGLKIYSFLKENNTCVTPAVGTIVKTTPASDNPQRAIFAYDLQVKGATTEPLEGETIIQPDPSTNTYTFTFKANANATEAYLKFYADAECTEQVGNSVNLTDIKPVTLGENEFTLSARQLPESVIELSDNPLQYDGLYWGIELAAANVTAWGKLYEEDRQGETGVVAVNINPQTDAFGRIYTFYRNQDHADDAGSFIYEPIEVPVKNPPQAGRDFTWGRLARMGMNQDGNVFFTDKSHTNPGIFIGQVNPENKNEMAITKFFQGNGVYIDAEDIDESDASDDEPSKHIYPIIKNKDGEEIASAIMAVDTHVREVTKDGVTKKHAILFAYAKGHSVPWGTKRHTSTTDGGDGINPVIPESLKKFDGGYEAQYRSPSNRQYAQADADDGFIPYHSILEYDLGALETRGLTPTWSAKPSTVRVIQSNNHEAQTANIWATSKGLFICHERDLNNNTNWAASLLFYDKDGLKLNSGTDPTLKKIINGSTGGAMAVTADEKTLIMQNATKQFLVFDITWSGTTPTLTLRAIYTHGQTEVNQMAFDYAGNLVATGANGMTVFAIPDPNNPTNRKFTPARSKLKVILNDPTYDRIFVGRDETNPTHWDVAANWQPAAVPIPTDHVLIKAPCEVNITDARVQSLDMLKNSTVTNASISVLPAMALNVAENIRKASTNPNDSYVQGKHPNEDLIWANWNNTTNRTRLTQEDDANVLSVRSAVAANTDNADAIPTLQQATLIYHDEEEAYLPYATVQLHGQTTKSPKLKWQYMGVPFAQADAADAFRGTWMYQWNEEISTWEMLDGWNHPLNPFTGYLLTHKELSNHSMKGYLQSSATKTINLTKTPVGENGSTASYMGANFLANSWTAPLHIAKFEEADFVNTQKTIYIYDSDNYQYHVLPSLQENAITTINSLQGFFVLTDRSTEAEGKPAQLILNYDRLIEPPVIVEEVGEEDSTEEPTEPAQAPARMPQHSSLQQRMVITITGNDGLSDNVRLFQNERYTTEFDDGYEGRKMEGASHAMAFTATTHHGEMAVLATPDYYGTMLNFRKGNTTEYTVTFDYDYPEETWVLEDLLANKAVDIQTGNSYSFTTNDTETRTRFRITRRIDSSVDDTTLQPNAWVANGQLYIENPTNETVDVRVYTVDGKLVQRVKTSDLITPLKVPIKTLYVIQITHTNSVHTIKQLL